MANTRALVTRQKLLRIATELFRQQGFVATTVDQICAEAQVTKGAFFHHFANKEELAKDCLAAWDQWMTEMEGSAPFQQVDDPVDRVLAYMEFFIKVFEDPNVVKSCLVGTTVQEVANTHPELRDAANLCLVHAASRLRDLLDAASRSARRQIDSQALAQLWMAALQGSLILAKAAQEEKVISASLAHIRDYIKALMTAPPRK